MTQPASKRLLTEENGATLIESISGLRNLAHIDLCAAPYSLDPGDDATDALNDALAAIGAALVSSRIYFSKPGDYTLNGALQTGTVLGYTYNGQVLFPGVLGDKGLTIVISGAAPITTGGAGRPNNGTRLVSNATDGWIFDCIPAFEQFGAVNPWTNVVPVFEDIIIQAPTDPQCGGINALTAQSFRCKGLQMCTAHLGGGGAHTGTKPAISLPQNLNAGQLDLDFNIRNWTKGIRLSEHTKLRGRFANVKYPLVADKGGDHTTHLERLDMVECSTMLHLDGASPPSLVLLSGDAEFEATLEAPIALFSGTGLDKIRGKVSLRSIPDRGLSMPATAALADISIANISRGLVGSKDLHPVDTFTRMFYPQTNPGVSWPTFHPTYVPTGSFSVTAAGSLKSTNGSSESRVIYAAKDRGVTRTVSAQVTLDAASPHLRVLVGYLTAGTYAQRYFAVDILGTNLRIHGYVNNTHSDPCRIENVVTLGATHVITAKVTVDPLGRPLVITAYVDGKKVCSYYPTEAEKGYMQPNTNVDVYPVVGDGISLYETGTVVKEFRVKDAPADEWVAARGAAVLSSGSVAVADAKITANSVVRAWHGTITGTAGAIQPVTKNAGVGFTITSDAAGDNNPVYWEVVSY